jgi:hypothetical protein
MKVLLGDFNTKVGREDIFKSTNENDSLHEISNDNWVRVVNFATTKTLPTVQCLHMRNKVKLSLCLTKYHAMKTYWGSGGIAPLILDLGTRCR